MEIPFKNEQKLFAKPSFQTYSECNFRSSRNGNGLHWLTKDLIFTYCLEIQDMHAKLLQSCRLFATLWTVTCQAPLFMGFSRQEWSGLLCPSLGDLPNPGIKPASLISPALAGRFFTLAPLGSPCHFQDMWLLFLCLPNILGSPNPLVLVVFQFPRQKEVPDSSVC